MKIAKPLKNWDSIKTSSPFGWRKDPFTGQTRFHGGIDKACNNIPVYAAKDGVFHGVFRNVGEVYIDHQEGTEKIRTVYAHMVNIPSGLRGGLRIRGGDLIGYSDSAGRVTGAHLHFGIVLLPSLEAVDPNLYFEKSAMANYELEKRGNDLWMTKITADHTGTCFVTRGGRTLELHIDTKQGKHDRKLISNMDPLIYYVDWVWIKKNYDNRPKVDPCAELQKKYDDLTTGAAQCAVDLGKANERIDELSRELKVSRDEKKTLEDKNELLEEKVKRLEDDFVSKVQSEVSKATKSLSEKLKNCRDSLKKCHGDLEKIKEGKFETVISNIIKESTKKLKLFITKFIESTEKLKLFIIKFIEWLKSKV